MPNPRAVRRLDEVSRVARAAEASGEDAAAGEAWRRYRLIRDAARDPDELLAEGLALSRSAMELAALVRTPG
jgi:negative regulator of sigma E activity